MGRVVNVAGVAIAVAAAAALYNLKLEASEASGRVDALRAEIGREHEAIAVLRAEWAELNAPSRLKGLAERHLALVPSATQQIVRAEQVPARLPQPAMPEADTIGNFLADAPEPALRR